MNFHRKVYYNNKPLILTNNRKAYIEVHPIAAGYLLFLGAFPRNFRLAFQHMDNFSSLGVIIEDISPDALIRELHHFYAPIDAAGGVVFNEDNKVLMIYRRGKWDLPKGKRDDGEDIDVCALREVQEETGLQNVVLEELLCETYHIYAQYGQKNLKRTVWYKMRGTKNDKLVAQAEENITEVKWMGDNEMGVVALKTYEAIKEVLHIAGMR